MKNLLLSLEQFLSHVDFIKNEHVVGITESANSDCYFGATKSGILFGINVKQGQVFLKQNLKEIVSTEEQEPLIIPQCELIGIQYVAELEALCLATNVGDIITYDVEKKSAQIVGTVEEGIDSMSWSPDQEVVCFATGSRTLLTMSKDWEILIENSIETQPISSSITNMTTISAITSGNVENSSKDVSSYRAPRICWRADGKMLAVNSIDGSDGKNWVRVWDRTGNLISKSEPIMGIGENIHWRPDNSIIASHQYMSNKNESHIIFLEKNGLQHYSFLIDKGCATINQLQWNIDSEVLFVSFNPHDKPKNTLIQLWYRSNYHWYLKQQFEFEEASAPSYVSWDAEKSLRLHVFCKDATYHCYDFCWDHFITSGNEKTNPRLATVVDGTSLNFTPLRYAVVPPPICTASIQVSSPIRNIAYLSTKKLLVHESNGSMNVYDIDLNTKPPKFGLPPKFLYSINIPFQCDAKSLRLLTFISESVIFAVKPSEMGKGDELIVFELSGSAQEKSINLESIKTYSYTEKIIRIHHHEATGNTFVQTKSGSLFIQKHDAEPEAQIDGFDTPCPQFSVCMMGGEEVTVGLTTRGVLYIQSNVASSTCYSFCLHDEFLLFTTYAHKLRIIPLQLSVPDAIDLAAAAPSSKYDESYREIERGAVILCAVPKDIRIVFQMPRGSIEAVNPRALILNHVKYLLNQQDYREALVICRKNKIDMNLLIDHDPSTFLENAKDFVQKVDSADYINLFLSQLQNEDITVSKYAGYFTGEELEKQKDTERNALLKEKVNKVCLALRKALDIDEKKYISSILTTYAKYQPPQLEEALTKIREIRAQEVRGIVSKDGASSDTALTYLIFLADVNRLYDIALGMYDFDLVLMVAQKSQKDPKEYLSFLSELQKMEKYFQRYNIDMHLKRYESALNNLSMAGERYFEECLEMVKKFGLYRQGISIFSTNEEKRRAVYEVYGEFLQCAKQERQAAFAFLQCGKLEKALHAFQLCGEFKYVFSIAKRLKQSNEEIRVHANKLVQVLTNIGKVRDVALIQKEYLGDDEAAIVTLISGQYWQDALRIAHLSERSDLIETHIKPAVQDSLEYHNTELHENISKLEKYIGRLVELREEKKQKENENIGFGEDDVYIRNMDSFSESSSIQSGATGSYSGVSVISKTSRASTKSYMRKKEKTNKKNRHKMRKGSPFEEENLVLRIQSLIPTVFQQEQVCALLEALIFFGHFDDAKKLQSKLKQLIQLCKNHATIIEAPYLPADTDDGSMPITKIPKKVSDIIGNFDWTLSLLEE